MLGGGAAGRRRPPDPRPSGRRPGPTPSNTICSTLATRNPARAALLAEYAAAPRRLEDRLRDLPPAARSYSTAAGSWTVTQVVVHLADNEAVDFVRVRMAIAESGSRIQRYDEARWARELDYAADDVDEALMAFRVLRSRTHRLLDRLAERAWSRVLLRPEGGQRTVDEKLRGDVEHDALHLHQIEQLREAWSRSPGASGAADASPRHRRGPMTSRPPM